MIILLFCACNAREQRTTTKKTCEIHHFPRLFGDETTFWTGNFQKIQNLFFLFFDLQRSPRKNSKMTTSHWPIVTEHEMMVMWSVPIGLFLLIVVWPCPMSRRSSISSSDRTFFKIDIEISNPTIINRDQKRRHV